MVSILTTKLECPPTRPGLVPRPHLRQRLDQGVQGKLTLVAAPAGYGKTTLIADWIHSSLSSSAGTQFTWLTLDENDNDPTRFLDYLIAALQKLDRNIGVTAQAMMQGPPGQSQETLLTTLINDIAATDQALILVLDDYHLIHTLPIHQQLAFLVEHQPAHMHLVLISREDPPLPLPRLRARGQMLEIRQGELRFSREECAAFLWRVLGPELSADDINALERRTEGWVAGLQMAAVALQSQRSTTSQTDLREFVQSFTGSSRYVLDYLIQEVLEQQPVQVQDFLLQTSILDRLSASLCDAVTAGTDSQDLLIGLEQANLFVLPLDQSREWYRYHHLFAELLRHRLQTSGTHSETDLHTRAYRWYEANGYLTEAVKHALAAEDWIAAEHFIGRAATETVRSGKFATLNRWLDALPEKIVRGSLDLATFKGWASFLHGQIATAGEYAELAEGLLRADTPPTSRAPVTVLRASLALTRRDIASAVALSQEGLVHIGDSDSFIRGLCLNNIAQAQMLMGDISAATVTFREMTRLSPEARQSPTTVSAWANLALLLNQGGRRREALALCQQALDRCVDSRGRPLPLAGYALLLLGILDYEANDLELARRHLLKGLEYGEQLGLATGIPVSGRIALAQLLQALGETDEAVATLEEVRQLAAQFHLDYVDYQIAGVRANILMKQGDLSAAERWVETAGLSPHDPPSHMREEEYFTFARLLLAQDRLEEAVALLVNLNDFAQHGGRQRSLITIAILQALAQQALGQAKQALSHLETALHLAAPEGYRRAFLDEGQALIDLLPKVRHLAPDFVEQLLKDVQSAPGLRTPPTQVQPLVEPLSDRELEVLRLVADGLSNREIAEELVISVGTVKTHVHNIYGKLEVRGRTQAAARARELDLA